MSSSWRARITRTATSPRFATRTRLNGIERPPEHRLDLEQELSELDGIAVPDVDAADDAVEVGLDLVHQLHRLEDAERLAVCDRRALLDERRRSGRRRPVERPDHRRLDADEAVRRRFHGKEWRHQVVGRRCRRGRSGSRRGLGLLAATNRYTHTGLLDSDLRDAALLDDADEVPDSLGAALVDSAAHEAFLAAGSTSHDVQQRFGLFAEEREEKDLLVARGETARLVSDLVEKGDMRLCVVLVREQLDRSLRHGVELGWRRAEVAAKECAQLVDHELVATRGEDVDQRLAPEDLADRRCERRPARLGADPLELREHLVQPVARRLRAQVGVEGRDQARRQVVRGRADGDARRERRQWLVSDVLVDEVRRAPDRGDVDLGVETEAGQRVRQSLAGDAMDDQGDWVGRAGDAIGARAGRFQRGGEGASSRALAVDADGEAADVGEHRNELARSVRLERAGGIVEQNPRGAEVWKLL